MVGRVECRKAAKGMHTLNNGFRFSGNGIGRAHLFNGILIVLNDDIIIV